jgi:hypothetical protein
MIRKFNYTERIKIKRSDLLVSIDGSADIPHIEADIRIGPYQDRLPPEGKIYVEAYHRTKFARFSFGTVAVPTTPENRVLASFGAADFEDIRFRVKVVDESAKHGRILAVAEGISQVSEDKRKANRLSLLGVDKEDIGDRIWKLDLERGDMPWLVVNERITDPNRLLQSDVMFFCMVYPEIIRQVLTYVLINSDEDFTDIEIEADDEEVWQVRWLWFGKILSGKKWPLKDDGEVLSREWIEKCSDSFCRNHRVLQQVSQLMEVK